MICCDTCPYFPTCEELDDFKRDVLGIDEFGYPIEDEAAEDFGAFEWGDDE